MHESTTFQAMLPDFLEVKFWFPCAIRGVFEKKRFKKHRLRRNHGLCQLVELKKMEKYYEEYTAVKSVNETWGESQTAKSHLNIGKWSVLGYLLFVPFSSVPWPSPTFCCCRLICMNNINRLQITHFYYLKVLKSKMGRLG